MTSQEPLKFEDFIPLPPWLQPPSTMEQVSKTQFHMPSPRSTWLGAACRGALGSTRRPAEHLARRWADPHARPSSGLSKHGVLAKMAACASLVLTNSLENYAL